MANLRETIEYAVSYLNFNCWIAILTIVFLLIQLKSDHTIQKTIKSGIILCSIEIIILSIITNVVHCVYGRGHKQILEWCYTLIYLGVMIMPFLFIKGTKVRFFNSTKGRLVGLLAVIYAVEMFLNLIYPVYFSVTPEGEYIEGPLWWLRPILCLIIYSPTILSIIVGKYRTTRTERLTAQQLLALIITGVIFYDFSYQGEIIPILMAIGLNFTYYMFLNLDLKRDPVTGLPNRTAYKNFALENSGKEDMVVASIDLNNLKVVNDSLGHDSGDQYLRANACTIADALEPYGRLYRTGGDEFVFLGQDLTKCKSILEELQKRKDTDEKYGKFNMSFAYGIITKDASEDVFDAVNRADVLMYENKTAIKGIENVRNPV